MKQLYAIRAFGGSYDDAWENVLFVTDDEDKGLAYCAKMNAMREVVAAAITQCNEYQRKWQVENPGPVLQRVLMTVEVPKLPNDAKKITKEMRDERKRLQELNSKYAADANKPIVDWYHAQYQAVAAFKSTFPEEIQKGIAQTWNDTYWEVEPVEWLE